MLQYYNTKFIFKLMLFFLVRYVNKNFRENVYFMYNNKQHNNIFKNKVL